MLWAISGLGAVLTIVSLYGWGRAVEAAVSQRRVWPMTLVTGLGGVIFVGGLANAVSIARPPVVDAVWIVGAVLAVLSLVRDRRRLVAFLRDRDASRWLTQFGPVAGLIAAFFLFTLSTHALPEFFNPADDYTKYLSAPLRMLATGSVRTGPLVALGADTLGAQAFLQGLFVAHLPLAAINVPDALVAATLCLLVVAGASQGARWSRATAPLLVTLAIVLDPQWVNVSATYTGLALCLFLFLLPSGLADEPEGSPLAEAVPRYAPVPIGLCYAALVALKSTYLPVVGLHFLLLSGGALATSGDWRRALRWSAKVAGAGFVFLLPWLVTHADRWSELFIASPTAGELKVAAQIPVARTPPWPNPLDQAFYGFGETYLHYLGLLILVIGAAVVLWFWRRRPGSDQETGPEYGTVASIAGLVTAVVFVCFVVGYVGRAVVDLDTALRLALPILLAATLAALTQLSHGGGILARGAVICAAIAVLSFAPSFAERAVQAQDRGTIFSARRMLADPKVQQIVREGVSDEERKRIRLFQSTVPAGAKMVVVMAEVFQLDFARNPILNVTRAGLVSLNSDFPFETKPDIVTRYFQRHGIAYVLWQYRGGTMPSPRSLIREAQSPYRYQRTAAIRLLIFIKALEGLAKPPAIVAHDKRFVLLKIGAARSAD